MPYFNAEGTNEVSGAAIKGWRGWRLTSSMHLKSLGVIHRWEPSKVPARHISDFGIHNHTAPQRQCSCGYWGMKTIDDVLKRVVPSYPVQVLGSINMWGRVFECEFGYRSEFAYPDVLYTHYEEFAKALRAIYSVDVVCVNSWYDIPHLLHLQQGGDAEAAA